jgi:DNA polymerase I
LKLIIDIETDGLLEQVSTIHCLVIRNVDTKEVLSYTSSDIPGSAGNIKEGVQYLKDNSTLIIGHNIIGYDLAVIAKLYDLIFNVPYFDTLIASKLRFSNLPMLDSNSSKIPQKLKGSHSLKAWGYRLGEFKGEYNDWSALTEEMLEYCIQDTFVTLKLYDKLKDLYPKAMDVEMKFKTIITRQELFGWSFNISKAQKLHVELLTEAEEIRKDVLNTFKPLPTWVPMGAVKQYNKDGSVSKVYQNQVDKGAKLDAVNGWGRYEYITFNPSSRDHIARWLQEVYGWKPEEYTEKGSIIINEKVLNNLEFAEGKLLAKYFTLSKLIGQLAEGDNAWLKKVGRDGRMHGSIDTLGAVTRRCTHSKPNVAQVPSSRAFKGKESRGLFGVPPGKKLVGCDADGLELRTLSHYMALYDKGAYALAVDQGKKEDGTDIHTLNQKAAGLPTRDDAKTFIYAFLYGAGDEKIGSIVGGDVKKGRALKRKFFKQVPAIKELIKQVKAKAEAQGFLTSLDGAKYHIRSSHSALNTLLQGAGALVMKYYLIFLDKNLEKVYTNSSMSKTPQYEFVGNIHDEVQIECDEGIAEEVAKIAEKTFEDVTTYLKFRIPLRGSAVVGDTWADTH